MSLQPGARLGPYEILAPIGAGGMGLVYKARDTRLDRIVAIKQSAIEFGDRFEREARAVAALNHPNICQLYDVGPDYLVMEFLDGRPLAPVEGIRKVLELAVQMADGIAAAHAAGIVHRDLKPDNIFVTADGWVKLLDFGIAKAVAGDVDEQHTRASLTDAGSAVGTVHYMSPEQARGAATIGPQSDQFSFGLILYELVTGQKAFARNSSAETLTAIIREDAAPLPASVPASLRWIIERLLAKDPGERYDSSRDLYRELKQVRDRLSDATAPASSLLPVSNANAVRATGDRRWQPLVAAVAAAVVAAGLTWTLVPRGESREASPPDLTGYRFTPITLDGPIEREPIWSPDGRTLAYTAQVDGTLQVMVRQVGATSAVQLTRVAFNARWPFWSPDGSRVYFRGAGLWSVSAVGGDPELAIEGATSAALHPRDGSFVFSREGRLWRIGPPANAAARDAQPFGQAPFDGAGEVRAFSPDGTKLLLLNGGTLWVVSYPDGAARSIALADLRVLGSGQSWMPDSRHVVTVARANEIGGGLTIVDTETRTFRTIAKGPIAMLNPSVSPDGARLAFVTGESRWKVVEVTLADGHVRTLDSGSPVAWFPSLAPDGSRIAFGAGPQDGFHVREITVAPSRDVVPRGITESQAMVQQVRWSPDGARVLFVTSVAAEFRLMVVPAAGGRAVPVDPAAAASRDGVWSPDGKQIAYWRDGGGERQIASVGVGTSAAPVVVKRLSTQDDRVPLDWSPDGRWILTRGTSNVFVMAADGSSERPLSAGTEAWVIGQPQAVFSRDGREVRLLRRDPSAHGRPWTLFAVDVASGKERVMTTVELPATADGVAGLSISPDGSRLYTSVADWPFDIWMLEGFQ